VAVSALAASSDRANRRLFVMNFPSGGRIGSRGSCGQ
jgi:hypothetical protein